MSSTTTRNAGKFTVIKSLDDKKFRLLSLNYHYQQGTDSTGRPNKRPMGGFVHMVLEVPEQSDDVFLGWMLNAELAKSGPTPMT